MSGHVAGIDERAPLLQRSTSESSSSSAHVKISEGPFTQQPASALPIALISALAVAATAATEIYTYANLLCKDAQHCDEDERRKFAGAVAIATTIANFCALFAVRGFEALSKRYTRVGLIIWLLVRSMSVGALSFGVLLGSVGVAMFSKMFEGLASDNILHFNLNAIYVRHPSDHNVSRLIGSSLALYMAGISISPSVAALLHNFRDSFLMAYALFTLALIYVLVAVRVPIKSHVDVGITDTGPRALSLLGNIISPFVFLLEDYWRLMPGLTLFLYNSVQSYTFSAVMVHTSVEFGFSSRENGFLLTIVHVVASLYLFFVLFAIPRLSSIFFKRRREVQTRARDAYMALASLALQGVSLVLLAFADRPWQVFAISAVLALGLASPSFIKSYYVASFEPEDKPRALTALTVMETGGSLFAPVILGGLQAIRPGRGVFFVAAGGVALATALLAVGVVIDLRRRGHR